MLRRLVQDESGMAMGLVIVTMVLVGVLGAGLLVFVNRDLETVVQVNRGQRALEVADAGVRAAQREVLTNSLASTAYDGGLTGGLLGSGDDSPWSYCYNIPTCTSTLPAANGSSGVRLDMPSVAGSPYAQVTILEVDAAVPTYKVVSEGRVGDARRKIEAVLKGSGATNAPRAYFTYGRLVIAGSATIDSVSFFAKGNIEAAGGTSMGTSNDTYFGRWAQTTGTGPFPNSVGSYPNPHNATPRASQQIGLGSQGTIIANGGFQPFKGTRSYDSTTTPRIVSDFGADGNPGQQSTEMAFPFKVLNADEDKQAIEALRQRALALEQTFPGQRHYMDSNPGNGVDDAGMPSRTALAGPLIMNDWYTVNSFQTVRFYEYQSYSANNIVRYGAAPLPNCSSATLPRGIIVLQNGDFEMAGNVGFEGAIMTRAYDSSGNVLAPSNAPAGDPAFFGNGSFKGEGSACLKGYANSSGNMRASGNLSAGGIPDMFATTGSGSLRIQTWRELYQ